MKLIFTLAFLCISHSAFSAESRAFTASACDDQAVNVPGEGMTQVCIGGLINGDREVLAFEYQGRITVWEVASKQRIEESDSQRASSGSPAMITLKRIGFLLNGLLYDRVESGVSQVTGYGRLSQGLLTELQVRIDDQVSIHVRSFLGPHGRKR